MDRNESRESAYGCIRCYRENLWKDRRDTAGSKSERFEGAFDFRYDSRETEREEIRETRFER